MAMAADDERTFEDLYTRARKGYACNNTVDIRGLSFDNAKEKLIKHVVTCINTLQDRSGWRVTKFRIGKTFVNEKQGLPLDPQDSSTYTKDGISRRWGKYQNKDYGRDGMVVLTIVTADAVPQDRRPLHQEDYTRELKKALVKHFMATHPYNLKIANNPPKQKQSSRASPAYALCMAYSLKVEESSEEKVVKDSKVEATWPIEIPESSGSESEVEKPVEDSKEAKEIRQRTKEVLREAGGEGEVGFEELRIRSKKGYACDYTVKIENLGVEDAKEKIIKHVDDCFDKLEPEGGQTVRMPKFYIGKTYVRQLCGGGAIDPQKSSTYEKSGIGSSWKIHRSDEDSKSRCGDGMVVLTIITEKAVPPAERPLHQEEYTLELKSALIKHFKATSPYKEKIVNKTSKPGKREKELSPAYALYMAYSLEEPLPEEEDKIQQVTKQLEETHLKSTA